MAHLHTYIFITILLLASGLTVAHEYQDKDPGNISFFKDRGYVYDQNVQATLRQSHAWKQFLQQNGNWWVAFDEVNTLPRRAYGQPIAIQVSGSLDARARHFLANQLELYALPVQELKLAHARDYESFSLVNYRQYHYGYEVLWSKASVRFNANGEVMMFGLDLHPDVDVVLQPSVTVNDLSALASAGLSLVITGTEPAGPLAILPVPAFEAGHDFRLVYQVFVHTDDGMGLPGKYYTLVDAHTGKVWYRANRVHNCAPKPSADLTIHGDVVENPTRPAVNYVMRDLMVTIGVDTFYTDSVGTLNLPNLSGPTEATIHLRGRFAEVVNFVSTEIPTYKDTLFPGNNTIDLTGVFQDFELAGYVHTSTIHTFMRSITPAGFTQMSYPFPVNVEIIIGNCNAFYNGSSINFYAAGGGCPATSLFQDVVFHEYGHGINYEFYDFNGGSFSNGALGEGYSDVWALIQTLDPVLAKGFQSTANSYIRRYDQNPKRYPENLQGQVHNDGEIIAGAWWDTYVNTGDLGLVIDLFVKSQFNTPDAPDGLEGQLYSDILLEVLMADDTDGNLLNGTPNDTAILSAFARHGITLLSDAFLDHTELLTTSENQPIEIKTRLLSSASIYLGDVKLHYRTDPGTPFTEVVMGQSTGSEFVAAIPAQQEGTIVEYYFTVHDIFNNIASITPFKANTSDPNLPYYLLVGYRQIELEDFDNQFGGWAINPFLDDNATTGNWDIGNPIPTYTDGGMMVQPGNGRSSAGAPSICAFTGNAPPGQGMGTNDIDGGKTTLQSPVFDLSSYQKPAIGYWRWYINNPPGGANPGIDFWQVFITNDLQNWVRLERTQTSDNSWRQKAIIVEDYVTPSATVSLLFVAQDSVNTALNLNGGSIVEAAVDDLAVYDLASSSTSVPEHTVRITLYPNPAQNVVQLHISGQNGKVLGFDISDLSGRSVGRIAGAQSNADTWLLPVGHLAGGLYLVTVHTAQGPVSRTLAIQR